MSIDTDQATVDRWLADGTWVQFAPGEHSRSCNTAPHRPGLCRNVNPAGYLNVQSLPPADWEAAQKCETCDGTGIAAWEDAGPYGPLDEPEPIICPDCNGTGKRRHPVTVPKPGPFCEECGGPCEMVRTRRITVAWATVEWGPLPVVERAEYQPRLAVFTHGGDLWFTHAVDGRVFLTTLPPDIDPQSLVGRWARGGRIEAS